jgi:hypothetical protein
LLLFFFIIYESTVFSNTLHRIERPKPLSGLHIQPRFAKLLVAIIDL